MVLLAGAGRGSSLVQLARGLGLVQLAGAGRGLGLVLLAGAGRGSSLVPLAGGALRVAVGGL